MKIEQTYDVLCVKTFFEEESSFSSFLTYRNKVRQRLVDKEEIRMANSTKSLTNTKIVRKPAQTAVQTINADVCIVGAGIAGVSAAVEAARLGNKVVLVDGMPVLGGLAGNACMGLFCGFFSNGRIPFQLTYGIAEEFFHDLRQSGNLYFAPPIAVYDEVALTRWMEEKVRGAGVTVLLNTLIYKVNSQDRRISSIEFTNRYGMVSVAATGYIDASGDASVAWNAGLPCRESATGPLYGTQLMMLEKVHAITPKDQPEVEAEASKVLMEKAADYGLLRKSGFIKFTSPFGKGTAYVNMTHVETPLDPLQSSLKSIEGKEQADRVLQLLKTELPDVFSNASIRKYGVMGIRQTRWIVGRKQIKLTEVTAGTRYSDAVARSSWPVELHNHPEGYVWKKFPDEHIHYVPYSSMISPEMDNLVACGRCIDGESAALSSVRVMGPCVATGKAAAHALDLADTQSVHDIDINLLQERLKDNLDRMDKMFKLIKHMPLPAEVVG